MAPTRINRKSIEKIFNDRIKQNQETTNEFIANQIKRTIIQKRLIDSGRLYNSVYSTKEKVLIDAPYARRIEYGFNGTDSLGRVYNQSPNPFIIPTLNRINEEISKRMTQKWLKLI